MAYISRTQAISPVGHLSMFEMSENNQKQSKRGGARKGAGRKAGAATTRTREIADKASSSGVTPLEVMLDNMMFAHETAATVLQGLLDGGAEVPEGFDQFKELLRMRGVAQECAKDAAPYMHPRLANVAHTGGDGGPVNMHWTVEFVAPKNEPPAT